MKRLWILVFGLFSFALMAQEREKGIVIQGVKCAKDEKIIFYKSGKLKSCSLSETCEIQGIKCAKGGLIEFYESGKLKSASLLNNQKIQGVLCSKRGVVKFFPSGRLQAAILARDTIINGIKYKKGEWIWFFDSDNLIVSDGIIKEKQKIDGNKIPQGARVLFFKTGKLRMVLGLKKNSEIQGIKCQGYAEFFKKNGQLKETYLACDQKIQGRTFPALSRVFFYQNGNLRMVFLSKNWKVDKIECLKAEEKDIAGVRWSPSKIGFWPSGKLGLVRLAKDTEIQGIKIPAFSDVRFYESGNLRMIHFSKDTKIGAIEFKKSFQDYFEPKIVGLYINYLKKEDVYDVVGIHYWQVPSCRIKVVSYILPSQLPGPPFVKCPPYVNFYDTKDLPAKVEFGVLAKKQIINGKLLPEGTWIHLDKNGHLWK